MKVKKAKKAKRSNGYIIYRGPSALDGKPIVAIASGVLRRSKNSKTGGMLQTYILVDGMHPMDANKSGCDFSICGNCPHRGKPSTDPKRKLAENRSCYVNLGQGVLQTWRALQRGNYPDISNNPEALTAIGRDRKVRIGTYGDGAAVPSYVWNTLLFKASGHTAYSHQACLEGAHFNPHIFMRSVDSLSEAVAAWMQGHRTFRVIAHVRDLIRDKEILCPATTHGATCESCGLCKGSDTSAKSIAIVAHGTGAGHFKRRSENV